MTRAEISNFYLQKIMLALRIGSPVLQSEVKDLIEAARADLVLGGVLSGKAADEDDPLIRRAVTVYVKAEFGLDNEDSEKYRESYNMLKRHLLLSDEYTKEAD